MKTMENTKPYKNLYDCALALTQWEIHFYFVILENFWEKPPGKPKYINFQLYPLFKNSKHKTKSKHIHNIHNVQKKHKFMILIYICVEWVGVGSWRSSG